MLWNNVSLAAAFSLREYIDLTGRHEWAETQAMLAREGESLDFRTIAPEPIPDDQNFCAIPALKNILLVPENADPNSPQGRQLQRLMDTALPDGTKDNPGTSFAKLTEPGALQKILNQAIKDMQSGKYIPRPSGSQGATLGKPADMAAWAAWLRREGSPPIPPDSGNPAHDVLAWLSRDDALVNELAPGLERPGAQWTPALKTLNLPEPFLKISLPHQSAVKVFMYTLCLRAIAAARAGDALDARQSLLIALRLNQANMEDPFFISALISCGESMVASNAVWELCDAHSGGAEDFRVLQDALSQLDYQKSFLYSLRGEVVYVNNTSEYMKKTRDIRILNPFDRPGPVEGVIDSLVLHLVPDGMFDANTAAVAGWYLDYYIKPLREGGFREFLCKQRELQSLVYKLKSQHPYTHLDEMVALIAMPSTSSIVDKVVYAQCLVNEAIAACALERYRIEHGTYPDSLGDANHAGEKPIPMDAVSGKPMGYRKTANGKYALWCVGLTGVDGGGRRVLDKTRPASTNFSDPNYRGDWVWDFPAN